MNINNVKEKIKKLLALSNDGANDHESYAALRRAQELMAKYKIANSDISQSEEKQECIKRKTVFSYGTRSSDHYLNSLAQIISENFCCVNFISTTPGTQTHTVWFMGMEDDVSICIEAMHIANNTIIKGYNKVYKDMCEVYERNYIPAKYFNPMKEGYIKGYLSGLKDALDSQKEEHQEWGLVLVAPQEAKDYYASLTNRDFGGPPTIDYGYYDKGYEEGKKFSLHTKINSNNSKNIEGGF